MTTQFSILIDRTEATVDFRVSGRAAKFRTYEQPFLPYPAGTRRIDSRFARPKRDGGANESTLEVWKQQNMIAM